MTTATGATSAIRHFHVIEAAPGCLPETAPSVTDNPAIALDTFVDLLDGWSQSLPPSDRDGACAAVLADRYRPSDNEGDSAAYDGALADLDHGHGVHEIVGFREFEIATCDERDCLRYCPDTECRTVAPVADVETRCWCCGTPYVSWERCPWLT